MTYTKNNSKVWLALTLVIALFVIVFTAPSFSTSLVQNAPIENTEDTSGNNSNNLMEEELKHATIMDILAMTHLTHYANVVQFPLHINLIPFLLIDELVKPPSFN